MTMTALDGVGTLQEQVRRMIVQDITDRRLAQGAQLPTEKQYVDRLGVSLVTVRGALASLVQAGLVERSSGRGTFVAEPRVPYEIKLMSSTSACLHAAGVPFEMKVLVAEPSVPPENIRQVLKVRRDAKAFRLNRIVAIRTSPAILLDSWLRRSVMGDLEWDEALLDGSSLYSGLSERGVRLVHAEGRVDLVRANDEEAALLRLPFGSPLFAYTCTARDNEGNPIEWARALYDATRFALTVSPDIGT